MSCASVVQAGGTGNSVLSLIRHRAEGRCGAVEFRNVMVRKRSRARRLLRSPSLLSPDRVVLCLDLDRNDRRFLLAGSNRGCISVYDLSKWGSQLHQERASSERGKRGPHLVGEDHASRVAAASITHKPVARSMRVAAASTADPTRIPPGHGGSVTSVRWYPVDSGAFLSSSTDGSVLVWDTNAMAVAAHLTPFAHYAHRSDRSRVGNVARMSNSSVTGMEISQLGGGHAPVVAACSDRFPDVKLLDVRTGAASHTLVGHTGPSGVLSLQWSPVNENVLASGGADGCVRLWDVRKAGSHACLIVLDRDYCPSSSYRGFGYRSDYSHLRRRATANTVPSSYKRRRTTTAAVGPNDYRHAEARDDAAAVSHGGSFVDGLAFASDGHFLVSTGSDGSLHLWDLRDVGGARLVPRRFLADDGGRPADIRRATSAAQQPVCVTADGGSASRDDVVWVRKGRSLLGYSMLSGGRPRHVLRGHLSWPTALAAVRDTMELVSAGCDGLILLWGTDPEHGKGANRDRNSKRRGAVDRDSW